MEGKVYRFRDEIERFIGGEIMIIFIGQFYDKGSFFSKIR